MKTDPLVSKFRRSLTRIQSTVRALARDAEYDWINGRSLPTGFKSRHSRQKAKITRALRAAYHCASSLDDTHLTATLIAIDEQTKEIIWHSQHSPFFNNDIDAREWAGWPELARLRVLVVEVRKMLKGSK